MTTKFNAPSRPAPPLAERRSLVVLAEGAGILGRMRANRVARKEAEKLHTALTVRKYQTLERVATAEISTVEIAVVGSIMGQGQRTASILAEDIASETGAAQVRLTALAGAERITHVQTRSEAYAAIQSRVQGKALSEAEAEALQAFADADLAADVERTNARINKSKDFIEGLHNETLGTLNRAFSHLS